MPNRHGRWTHREKRFVQVYAVTRDSTYSAAVAGYPHPQQAGSRNASNEVILAEARRLTQRQLTTEILPLATARHKALLEDPKCTGQALNRAIELAYKYGLATAEDGQHKEPSEMTAEELERARQQLLGELAQRANPVIEGEIAQPAPNIFD